MLAAELHFPEFLTLFDLPDFDAHEGVHMVHDAASGMSAVIAIHSTHLGPAAGGCRYWRYARSADAVTDALRLARGMSYKNAMAGLPMGGGKAVMLAGGAGGGPKSPAVMEAFGRAVDALGGRYVTAEDVGMTVPDMEIVAGVTRYVTGIAPPPGVVGGDPGPVTSVGVLEGMRAGVAHALGRDGFAGVHVAVQGVGSVGGELARLLAAEGARLTLADLDRGRAAALAAELGAAVAGAEEVHAVEADVLSPCALGATLNARTIPAIRAKLVAGAANNQLEGADDGARLFRRGIAWAPDYVINAGGIVFVTAQYLGETDADAVWARVRGIGARVADVLAEAAAAGVPPGVVADAAARQAIGRGD